MCRKSILIPDCRCFFDVETTVLYLYILCVLFYKVYVYMMAYIYMIRIQYCWQYFLTRHFGPVPWRPTLFLCFSFSVVTKDCLYSLNYLCQVVMTKALHRNRPFNFSGLLANQVHLGRYLFSFLINLLILGCNAQIGIKK